MKLKLNFISSTVLNEKTADERIKLILDRIKDGSILIVDGVMKPEEEMALVKETMKKIGDGFVGIEICSMKRPSGKYGFILDRWERQKEWFQRIFSELTGNSTKKTGLKTGITLIGPAKVIKKVKKNPDSFFVLAGD